jgi:hypothetical protein
MTIETSTSEELLVSFRERYTKLTEENQQLVQKIKENEVQSLKLLGAIETLEYLEKSNEEEPEPVEE